MCNKLSKINLFMSGLIIGYFLGLHGPRRKKEKPILNFYRRKLPYHY